MSDRGVTRIGHEDFDSIMEDSCINIYSLLNKVGEMHPVDFNLLLMDNMKTSVIRNENVSDSVANDVYVEADIFMLINGMLMPIITSIPTPMGVRILVEEVDAKFMELYVHDRRAKCEWMLIPFKMLTKRTVIENLEQLLVTKKIDFQTVGGCTLSPNSLGLSNTDVEVEWLHLELQRSIFMNGQAWEDLVHAQNKIQLLSSEYFVKAHKMNVAQEREESFMRLAAKEKVKHMGAKKEVELARQMLSKESHEEQIAEINALQEYLEKQKLIDELVLINAGYKKYTRDEIEVETDFFSETKLIGEGTYGKICRCNLDHTHVAINVLHPNTSNKRKRNFNLFGALDFYFACKSCAIHESFQNHGSSMAQTIVAATCVRIRPIYIEP